MRNLPGEATPHRCGMMILRAANFRGRNHAQSRCGGRCLARRVGVRRAGQGYPSKPLRLVVAFPAGGPIDFATRVLQPKVAELLGQQVIVDNRAGANGKHL